MDNQVMQVGIDLQNQYQEQFTALGPSVEKAFRTVVAGAELVRTAYTERKADLATLDANADLVPQAGYLRLKTAINAEAEVDLAAGHRVVDAGFAVLRRELSERAMPTLNPAREASARQELGILVDGARGEQITERLRTLALSGSDEALGALFSGFGESLLTSRDVAPEQVLPEVKSIVLQRRIREGDRFAVAYQALDRFEGLRSALPTALYV